MLKLDDITQRYQAAKGGQEVLALDGVSVEVEAGKFVALKGPSGCGKSTLLLIAGGLLRPSAGDVRIEETHPYALAPSARASFRASTVGFVFQQFHLVPYLDVLDNVLAPGLASGVKDESRARELLTAFGLEPRLHHTPAKLSTGERQRTAMARALYNRPKVLLADEPTGNLDPDNAELILRKLGEFASGGGAVLMVTHDTHATSFAHEVLRMERGKIA